MDAQIDRLGAIERRGARRAFAVVERPGAGGADRNRAGEPHRDRMLGRRQIAFLDVVAGAGLVDPAGRVDAQPADHVAGPAAAVALHPKSLFRCQHGGAAQRLGMQQEVAFLAEQPKAVADFPLDLQAAAGAGGLDRGRHRLRGARAGGRTGKAEDERRPRKSTEPGQHRDHGPPSTLRLRQNYGRGRPLTADGASWWPRHGPAAGAAASASAPAAPPEPGAPARA